MLLKKKFAVNGAMIFLILMTSMGCATVPKESVELNQEVGKGILESQRTHVNLLNKYFVMKKAQVDLWIESEYLPEYIKNIKNLLKKAGKSETLDDAQIKDIIHDVITERDQKQADLEKTRLLLLEKVDTHYDQLIRANSSVTALLQSLVDVKEATKSISSSIKSESGGKVDIDAIDQKFSEYLQQAGSTAKNATSLYEQVKQMTSK